MNIAICDDVYQDKHCLFNSLSSFCATNYFDAAITEYDSGEALVETFAKGMFDIIFLDIYMNGLSGIDTAKKIRDIDKECLLVFVTSSNEHAVEGFAVNALHYLIKPISAEKLAEVFARCQKILDAAQYLEGYAGRCRLCRTGHRSDAAGRGYSGRGLRPDRQLSEQIKKNPPQRVFYCFSAALTSSSGRCSCRTACRPGTSP